MRKLTPPTISTKLETIRTRLETGKYRIDLDLLARRIVDSDVLKSR